MVRKCSLIFISFAVLMGTAVTIEAKESQIKKVGGFSFGQSLVNSKSYLGIPTNHADMFKMVGLYDAVEYAIFDTKGLSEVSTSGTINTAYLLYTPITKKLFCVVMHSDNYGERNEYADSLMKKYGVTFQYKERQYGAFSETFRREATFSVGETTVFFVTEYISLQGFGSGGDVNIFYIYRPLEKQFKDEIQKTKKYQDRQKEIARRKAEHRKAVERAREERERKQKQKKAIIDSL